MKAAPYDPLLRTLEERFTQHRLRHPDIHWDQAFRNKRAPTQVYEHFCRFLKNTGGFISV